MICRHCGEDDGDSLLHIFVCDGRQGAIEALEPMPPALEPPAIETTTITTPRETSVRAFYDAIAAGVITTRRDQVFAGLAELGSATANETFEHVKTQRREDLRYDSNTRARFTELRDLGLIREVGARPCRITGKTCITWEIVPEAEYAGPAVVHRCETCGQIVSRDVPELVTP
jgi:hypothetical protein